MNNNSDNSKTLSSVKLVYLLLFLSIIGVVILVAAGTFKAPSVSGVKPPAMQNDVNHGSADMNALSQIMALEEKVKNNPNDLVSLLNLSHLLNDSGFFEKAILNYKKYLAKDPQNVDVIIDMGVCYYQTGDYDSAIQTMEKEIKINPKHQIANFNLGIINSAKGDISRSKEYFEKAVKLDPNSDIGIKAKDLLDNH